MLHPSGHFRVPPPFGRAPPWVEIGDPTGERDRIVLERPTPTPARSHNTNFYSAEAARPREAHALCVSWGFIGTSWTAAILGRDALELAGA
jgi:hypothetical protein